MFEFVNSIKGQLNQSFLIQEHEFQVNVISALFKLP